MNYEMLLAISAGIFVGPASGYLGSIMVSRHMALVGDALSHVALPGLALGIILNFDPFIGAFSFVVAAMLITWYVQKNTRLSPESIIGVLFVLALAIGILITPEPDLMEALFGDITKVTLVDVVMTAAIATAVVFITRRIYSGIVLGMISEDLAVSHGIRYGTLNLIYLLLVAAVVAIGIKEVGTILVGAVVIVPAAAARNVSRSLKSYSMLSLLFGLLSALAGITASFYVNVPAGPLVVIAGSLIFAATFLIWKFYLRMGKSASG